MNDHALSLPSSVAVALIRAYQRYLSPYKGFVCAHRFLNQGESCSQFGLRLVQEQGIWRCVQLMPARFRECRAACELLYSDPVYEASEAKRRRLQELEGSENEVPNWCWYASNSPCPCDDVSGCFEIGSCIDIG